MPRTSEIVDRERQLVGRLIVDPRACFGLTLKPGDFFDAGSRKVYAAILDLLAGAQTIPTLEEVAAAVSVSDDDLLSLTGKATKGPIDGVERLIREASIDRAVRAICERISLSERYGGKLLDVAQTAFNDIDQATIGGGEKLSDLLKQVMADAEAAKIGESDALITGDSEIDKMQWLQRGGVHVIAGRPGMGKSALCAYLLKRLAQNGEKCLLMPTEMANKRVAKRYLSAESHINSNAITAPGDLPTSAWDRLTGACCALNDLPIWIDDSVHRSGTIARSIREHRQRYGITVAVVDHVQKAIDGVDPQRELFELLNNVQAVAAEKPRITLILVSQLNRAVEKRPDKHPLLSDLRESGKLEEDADGVGFCYRPSYYDDNADKHLLEFCLAKSRDGALGVINMDWSNENGYVNGQR